MPATIIMMSITQPQNLSGYAVRYTSIAKQHPVSCLYQLIIFMQQQYRSKEAAFEQPPTVSLSQFSLDNMDRQPLQIDFAQKLQWFISLNFIKFKSILKRHMFIKLFLSPTNQEYVTKLFWYLLMLKLPIIVHRNITNQQMRQLAIDRLTEQFKTELAQAYVRVFIMVPYPKQEMTNLLVFSNVFFIMKLYNELFKKQQMDLIMNSRFIYDNHHIVIFQTLGMEVSDMYLATYFNKLFHNYYSNLQSEFRKSTQYHAQKQKQLIDKLTPEDFFQGKIQIPTINNSNQAGFMKQIEECMAIRDIKKKPSGSYSNKILSRRDSKISLHSKSSLRSKEQNDLMNIRINLEKKKSGEQLKRYEEERKKAQILNNIIEIQNKDDPVEVTKSHKKEVLSLAKLGPCVSQFLDNRTHRLTQIKHKLINHPEEKILNNDYLRRLITEKMVTQKPKQQMIKKTELDLTKPMKSMSFKQIRAYREISQRQLQRPYLYNKTTNLIKTLEPQLQKSRVTTVHSKKTVIVNPLDRHEQTSQVFEQGLRRIKEQDNSQKISQPSFEQSETHKDPQYQNNLSLYRKKYGVV